MPNFNKAIFLAETFNSVLKQTLTDWEIILVDDGSTDDSRDIIANFAAKDKRIKPVYREKQLNGGSVCRNIGIDNSKGEFIMFLDSDDLLVPKCLEKRVKFSENNKHLDFSVFPMGSFLKKVGDLDYCWNPVMEKALERFLSHELPWAICQPIFKTSFLKENKYRYSDKYSRLQDVYFHTIILLDNPVFETVVSIPDCFYRVDETRKTDTNIEFYRNYANSVILYFQEINMRLESNNIKRELHKTLLNAIYEINIGRISKKISRDEYQKLSNEILRAAGKQAFVLHVYRTLCSIFPLNIRGLRFMFLKVI